MQNLMAIAAFIVILVMLPCFSVDNDVFYCISGVLEHPGPNNANCPTRGPHFALTGWSCSIHMLPLHHRGSGCGPDSGMVYIFS